MRKVVCALLIHAMLVSPALVSAGEIAAPLRDAIAKEGIRLAGGSPRPSVPDGWSAVVHISHGTPLLITTPTGRIYGRFITADRDRLVVLKTELLSAEAGAALAVVARDEPAAFSGSTATFRSTREEVVISGSDIFFKSTRVGSLTELVQAIGRASIDDISAPRRHLSKKGAAGGALAAFVLSLPISLGIGFSQCGRSCTDEHVLIAVLPIGLPIAGGFLGAYAFSKQTSEVIYRR